MIRLLRFKVVCIPWVKTNIRSMTIDVVSDSEVNAREIVMREAHKFFDQDMRFIWTKEPIEGYIKEVH